MPPAPLRAGRRAFLFGALFVGALPACAQAPALLLSFDAPGPVAPTAESPAASGWKAVKILDELEHPWGLTWLPGGELLITERPGRLRIVRDGKLDPKPIAGLPEIFARGQGGLMDVALHPKFAENQLVYLTLSAGTPQQNHTTLVRGRLDDGALRDVRTIFAVEPRKGGGQHFGARILWLPDGTLLLSVGDGGNPPARIGDQLSREHAQRTDSHLGKVLRLTDDGLAAEGNPFAADKSAKPEVWTLGHRNIQGLARDPESGRIWATEHGALGGDELNLLEAGRNYGWPKATYSREYSGAVITDVRALPGMTDPTTVWTPCIAPSGLLFYTGDKFPEWRGDLLAGGLVLRQIRRIDLDGEKVVGEQTLKFDQRIRDVRQGPDGYIYVLTDEDRGQLLRLEPVP
jgi:glucose/arabinose dehydrogenase